MLADSQKTTRLTTALALVAAVASCTAVAHAAPHRTAALQLAAATARARAVAEREGFVRQDVTRVAGHDAVLVRYGHGLDPRRQRLDMVGGSGATLSTEDTMLDVTRPSAGGQLWNLRGDGDRFLVVTATSCGANCSPSTSRVFELVGDAWRLPSAAPERPTAGKDENGDAVPEFPMTLVHLKIVGCPRVACGPTYEIGVDIDGVEAWDGRRYARDLAAFAPMYAARLAKAKADAAALPPASTASASTIPGAGECPTDAISAAGRLYAYSRLTGLDARTSIGTADAVMHGRSTAKCAEGWAFDGGREWAELRRELLAARLPALPAVRVAPQTVTPARTLVILYGAPWCGACRQAAAYMDRKGIAYVEKDIDSDAAAHREMDAAVAKAGLRGGSIPVIDARGKVMVGLQTDQLDAAVAANPGKSP